MNDHSVDIMSQGPWTGQGLSAVSGLFVERPEHMNVNWGRGYLDDIIPDSRGSVRSLGRERPTPPLFKLVKELRLCYR